MQDKEQVIETFQERLRKVIANSGLGQSAFAREVGMDRSTLSQLLSGKSNRLPRVENLLAIADKQVVSLDWLLGIRQDEHLPGDILEQNLRMGPDGNGPDERLNQWYQEAIGHKIRYVPRSLPDLLKTDAVIKHEYEGASYTRPDRRKRDSVERLAYQRRPETDMEVCNSVQAISSFVKGEGLWQNLDKQHRYDQLKRMIKLTEELYPTFRWFLFDILSFYSAPMTIFGAQKAVLYIGDVYLVFNGHPHIRVLTQHFDSLIKGATVNPTEIPTYLENQLKELK